MSWRSWVTPQVMMLQLNYYYYYYYRVIHQMAPVVSLTEPAGPWTKRPCCFPRRADGSLGNCSRHHRRFATASLHVRVRPLSPLAHGTIRGGRQPLVPREVTASLLEPCSEADVVRKLLISSSLTFCSILSRSSLGVAPEAPPGILRGSRSSCLRRPAGSRSV